jgi:hypothetical protein
MSLRALSSTRKGRIVLAAFAVALFGLFVYCGLSLLICHGMSC